MAAFLQYYLVSAGPARNPQTDPLPSLKELERDYIGYLLAFTDHNKTEVSRILAISRTALYHKLSRLRNPGPPD